MHTQNRLLIFSVTLFLGFAPFANAADPSPMPVPKPSAADHVTGRKNAAVTMIVYSDFECPFCAKHYDTVKKILRTYRGKVSIIYRQFPLPFHTSALPAAKASECVAKLKGNDAFWQFVNRIFRDGASTYEATAAAAGIDPKTLKTCMASKEVSDLITKEINDATDAVSGTPASFLVNTRTGKGETLEGSQPFEDFQKTIDSLLQTSKPTANPTPAPTPTPAPVPTGTTTPSIPPVSPSDHVRGKPDARFSLVVYMDYECPFCRKNHSTIQKILATYPDTVNIVYRHYPLSFHANSEKEAEAAECAAEVGGNDAFWKFTDGIFAKTTSNGTGFALSDLPILAGQIGLDKGSFQACLDGGQKAKIVSAEEDTGTAAGIQGTPANELIDHTTGKVTAIEGAQPFEEFQKTIDSLIK
jgi:protein-disulfide isomerase